MLHKNDSRQEISRAHEDPSLYIAHASILQCMQGNELDTWKESKV